MEALWPPQTLAGWLFLIGLAAVVAYLGDSYLAKRRRRRWERAALEMGFSFEAEGKSLAQAPFLGLPLLEQTKGWTLGNLRSWRAENVLRGEVGTGEAVVADIRVQITTHRDFDRMSRDRGVTQTVVFLRLAGKQFPTFELLPEGFWHQAGLAFDLRDIDFEAHPSFSESYVLRGQDEGTVRALFHSGLLSFFEQQRGWNVEGAGEWLAVYKKGLTKTPEQIREFVEQAGHVAAAFT